MPEELVIDGKSINLGILSETEKSIFNEHFDRYIAPMYDQIELTIGSPPDPTTSSTVNQQLSLEKRVRIPADVLSQLLQSRKDHVRSGVAAAKSVFTSAVFKGVEGAGSDIVFGPIRAWHILRTTDAGAETTTQGWDLWNGAVATLTPTAWAQFADNWIGWGANNGTAINIDRRALIVVLGFAELSENSPVESIQLQINGDTMTPTSLQQNVQLAPSDSRVPIVPCRTVILRPGDAVLGTAYTDISQISKLIAVGVTIGTANYMNNHRLATVQL